ncbi:type II toxin-antitoxin system BrnA family antitoxin [Hippea alviniae]|uniref:type II toxin-antitoxin system BrnA family antitoxin n=1 Tax=Hippea alviniae TaxID=1279027 RepID=UPI0003B66C3A|nr:CopG family antitoxin [Hippea alviniae]
MKKILTKEFDEMFDKGEDISDYLDISNAIPAKQLKESLKTKRVNVDFPVYIVNKLDLEAKKIGVTRQSLIKMWIAEKLSETK